jgi:uncharacterized protein YdiU (UPF0061 family)
LNFLKNERCLSDLPVVKYCEMDQVIDAYIERNEDSNNADTALKALIKAFKTLSEKHQCSAVKRFSSSLREYYHYKKEKFSKLYDRRLELLEKEEDTQHEGDLVGMEVVKKDVQNYKRKLNKSMDNANKEPNSPKTTKRTKQNDSNATSQASTTLPIESIATSSPLRNKIPASALEPVSSPTVAPIISPRLPLSTNTQTMHHDLNTSTVLYLETAALIVTTSYEYKYTHDMYDTMGGFFYIQMKRSFRGSSYCKY